LKFDCAPGFGRALRFDARMKTAVTLLVFCVAALLALGLVMLYSAKMTAKDGAHLLMMQSIWAAFGLAAAVGLASLDYKVFKQYAWPLLIVSAVLLCLVFVPVIGKAAGGAHRWLDLRVMRVQPSELAKLAMILTAAWYCERYARQMQDWKRGILIPACIFGPMLLLIFVEPDRGTTVLMAAVLSVVFIVAGVRWQYFAVPVVLGLTGFIISIIHDPMRMRRIFAWLDVEGNKSGVGYQAYQAMLALGSGGWTGLGLGNGRQKLGYVPEHHTDFILSVIGEELGLVATLAVVVAFLIIIICGVFISTRARETFGMLLGCGITFLIGFQAFINIGVVTSALPNKGLALPFISYGGSSLVMMLSCVGVLVSIARQARDSVPVVENPLETVNPFASHNA
jgi:cell division protein FtsW